MLGALDDLLLVRTDERTEHRQRHHLVNSGDVLERLRRDLAERFARHNRLGTFDARDTLSDRVHDAAIHDDSKFPGAFD